MVKVTTGEGTYGDANITYLEYNLCKEISVKIGKYCSIGEKLVIICDGEHNINNVTTYPFSELDSDLYKKYGQICKTKGDIIIGNDVWIGYGVTILSGVTIGDGAVIGAKSVVASDVPPYAVVVGNPAKILKYRFDTITIRELLKIKWWNWSKEKIINNMDWLLRKPKSINGENIK